ncbi:MAG: signal transduction histidine kinase [Gammaproteobacteria bacterium]|jgi:signal transduction histidine kinase
MTNVPPPGPSDFDATALIPRMGHDFNNLFSIVLGGLSLLREEIPESAWNQDSEEIYADIISATREAAGVIVQLNAWAARQSIERQNTNVNDVAKQAGELLRRALPDSVQLELSLESEPVMAWVDQARLLDAILELAANSRAAMPSGGTLTVATCLNEQFGISITDTGTGMDESTLQRCKQPYFTTRDSAAHRGLGLSVIDGFMRASDARLCVDSTPGEGTCVSLLLPAARTLGLG